MSNDLPPLSGPVDASGEPTSTILTRLREKWWGDCDRDTEGQGCCCRYCCDYCWHDYLDALMVALAAAAVPSSPAQPVSLWGDDFPALVRGAMAQGDKARRLKLAEALRREADILSALPPDSPTWQPIETAPKDGTNVLVGSVHRTPKLAIDVARWREEFNEWYTNDLRPFPAATHWMPLPSAPSPSAGANEEQP